MKPLLLGDRATSAVPASSSFAARFGVWARESLVARAIAVAAGLLLLAAIGGSAFAGSLTGRRTPAPAPAPEVPGPAPPISSASAPIAAAAESPDAGAVPVTRPELLPESPEARPPPSTRATPDDPVELNSARLEDLRRLPGIGAKRAEAVLALRAHLPGGRFRQLEDLLKVKGIGRAMLKRLHPLVRINP